MEWGPRALGNRSILADPRNATMKDILNDRVKHREDFRPFAPAILEERMSEYMDLDCSSPFMLLIAGVRKEQHGTIPAVTHVDGTARPQSVNRDQNPLFYDLIKEFHRQTGVPVLINTSFNVRGEPIVCSPTDALNCFLSTGIDVLVMDQFVVEK
jgi:carbamoyltransferase